MTVNKEEKATPSQVSKFITAKLLSVVTIIGAVMAIINWAPEIGDMVVGAPVRYYSKPLLKKEKDRIKALEDSLFSMKIRLAIEMNNRDLTAQKFTEVLCTILKGELTPFKIEQTKFTIYRTKGYYDPEGILHSGDYYFFDHENEHLNCFPFQAIYNSTLNTWGYIDQGGGYHKLQ